MVDKIKDLRSSPSLIISTIPRKWLLPIICFLLIYDLIITWNITSYAYTKTVELKTINTTTQLTQSTTQTPTLTPTLTPTPTQAIKKVTTVTQATENVNISEYLLTKVNEYRRSLGLSEVSSNSNTCNFAKKRAQELNNNFNHDGFKNLPYPSYSKVVENIAMTSNFANVVNQWINSPGHAENMRADTPFVCIENFGDFYAYEGWKP